MCGLYIDYGSSAVQCGRHICSKVYANNMKCMYMSASGHIIDCI